MNIFPDRVLLCTTMCMKNLSRKSAFNYRT